MTPIDGSTPTKSVLVVEAEGLIRIAVAEYLRECGYDVFQAGNADEAIALLESTDKIDIAFIDLGPVGDFAGLGLARWLSRKRPQIKTIFTSSSAGRTAEEAGELCKSGPILAKPYHHHDLERRIRQALAMSHVR